MSDVGCRMSDVGNKYNDHSVARPFVTHCWITALVDEMLHFVAEYEFPYKSRNIHYRTHIILN